MMSSTTYATFSKIVMMTNAKTCHRRPNNSMVLLERKEDRKIALSAGFDKGTIRSPGELVCCWIWKEHLKALQELSIRLPWAERNLSSSGWAWCCCCRCGEPEKRKKVLVLKLKVCQWSLMMILNDNDNDSGEINADVRFYKDWNAWVRKGWWRIRRARDY